MSSLLLPGDTAPWFHAPALEGNPRYAFDTVAGRCVVLLFHGSAAWEASAAALAVVARHHALFDDAHACFFGVSLDPADAAQGRIAQAIPGIRWFLDHDATVARKYGAVEGESAGGEYRPHWLLLDPMLRVVDRAGIEEGERIIAGLRRLIARSPETPTAPVLVVPRIFEPALCRQLVELYQRQGGEDSGFMREENGVTVGKIDYSHKRRADCSIDDEALRGALRARIRRFLIPQIARAFQFEVTRIERWIVACYDDQTGGGHFRAHRDNTTKGTAHRRFACTINLNAGEYDGGDLRFPEFGPATYRAPTGGAVIFSCSLLHEALPVTRGTRYAFLPFLYDDAAARLREANLAFVSDELKHYRSGLPADAQAAE